MVRNNVSRVGEWMDLSKDVETAYKRSPKPQAQNSKKNVTTSLAWPSKSKTFKWMHIPIIPIFQKKTSRADDREKKTQLTFPSNKICPHSDDEHSHEPNHHTDFMAYTVRRGVARDFHGHIFCVCL